MSNEATESVRRRGVGIPHLSTIVAGLVVLATAEPRFGQQTEDQKFFASDGDETDFFGAVAAAGGVAVVGAYGDEDNGPGSGSAYIFRRDGETGLWAQEAKLVAFDGALGDTFGGAVATTGTVAVIGAFLDDDAGSSSGSAYVFRRDELSGSWNQEAKLISSDSDKCGIFGASVAISQDVIVVGARNHNHGGTMPDGGAAYVFRYDWSACRWAEEQELLPSDLQPNDGFGQAVAVSGDLIVVGAPFEDTRGADGGAAYVFRYSAGTGQWNEEAKILAQDGSAGDVFGGALDLCYDRAVVGAFGDDDNGLQSGSAYVFRFDGVSEWLQEGKLVPSDGTSHAAFGVFCALEEDWVAVTAVRSDTDAVDAGAAYLFHFDENAGSWVERSKLLASDADDDDQIGSFVALSEKTALVSATRDDDLGTNAGAIYVFHCAALGDGMPATALPYNGSGCNPFLFTQSTPAIINTNWRAAVDIGLIGAELSFVFAGLGGVAPPGFKFGDAGEILCLPPFVVMSWGQELHQIFVANDCSLVGQVFCLQAGVIQLPEDTVRLTNAIELRVGTH